MKVSPETVKELSEKIAEALAAELEAKHAAALIIHEEEVEIFIRLHHMANRRNPIDGKYLEALRKGLDHIWDASRVLSGRDMDFLSRSLDVAQKQRNWEVDSENHELANAY